MKCGKCYFHGKFPELSKSWKRARDFEFTFWPSNVCIIDFSFFLFFHVAMNANERGWMTLKNNTCREQCNFRRSLFHSLLPRVYSSCYFWPLKSSKMITFSRYLPPVRDSSNIRSALTRTVLIKFHHSRLQVASHSTNAFQTSCNNVVCCNHISSRHSDEGRKYKLHIHFTFYISSISDRCRCLLYTRI